MLDQFQKVELINYGWLWVQPEFSLDDLPLFVVTSGAAGLLGACLNTAHGWLSQLRPSSRHRLLRFSCLALLTNLICCWSMLVFRSMQWKNICIFYVFSWVLAFFLVFLQKKFSSCGLSKVELKWNKLVCRIIEACSITFIAVGAIFSLPHFFGHCLEIQKEWEFFHLTLNPKHLCPIWWFGSYSAFVLTYLLVLDFQFWLLFLWFAILLILSNVTHLADKRMSIGSDIHVLVLTLLQVLATIMTLPLYFSQYLIRW